MIPDNAKELTLGEFLKKCSQVQCPILPVESYVKNANQAEDAVRD